MKRTAFEPVSVPLEDEIPTPYTVVGSQKWFDTAFEANALRDDQKTVISDPAQLQPIVVELLRMNPIGVDTETTGPYHSQDKGYALNPVNNDCRVVLLQLGNEDHVWLIDPAYIEQFRPVLENDKQLHLAHNWEYDFKWLLWKNKIHPIRLYCSMLAEQLLTAGLAGFKVGLADCARRYPPNWLISKAVRSMFIDLGDGKMTYEMVKYAARDIPLLFPVFRGQVEAIRKHGMEKVAKLEFDNIPVCAEMETGGIRLDQDKLKLLIMYWEQRQLAMEERILELFDRRKKSDRAFSILPEWREVFNLNSNKDKRDALRRIGVKLNDVKRATLLASNDEVAILLAEYSHILKMTTTYGDNLLKKINRWTGRYHPRFAQMGFGSDGGDGRDNKETTATGRWVGDAQQFPRKSDGHYAQPRSEAESAEVDEHFAALIDKILAEEEQEERAAHATLPIPASRVDGPS